MIEGERTEAGMFSAGEPLSARKLNQLAELATRSRTTINTGIKTTRGPFGTVYNTDTPVNDTELFDYPFKVIASAQANKVSIQVRPGTVNNFVPQYLGKYLDDPTVTKMEFTSFTASNKKIVALKATQDGVKFFPNTVEVVLLDNESQLTDTDANGYIQIASISGINSGGKPVVSYLYQYIYASLIVVRAKPGSLTANWSWTSR